MGDSVHVEYAGDPGARVLVPVHSGELPPWQKEHGLPFVRLESDGTFVCQALGMSSAPPLTKVQFATVVQSESCAKMLAALDVRWGPAGRLPRSGRWLRHRPRLALGSHPRA